MSNMPQQVRVGRAWIVLLLVVMGALRVYASDDTVPAAVERVFALVGGEKIGLSDYQRFVQFDAARRFYHGKKAVDASQHSEWTQEFIDRVLLLQEAARRGISSTPEGIKAWLDQVVARGNTSIESMALVRLEKPERERWATNELVLEALRRDVVQRVKPDTAEVRRFYEQHAEKFTTPEQLGISMILLEVPPYAPASTWDDAQEHARDLHRDLTQGVPFEVLAQEHSRHESSRQGGNLGLIHGEMLSRELQGIVAMLQPGQISLPQLVLQGVVIVRVNERLPPRLNQFEAVSARARELLVRDLSEVAWRDLIRRLRESVSVVFQPDRAS